jgi:formylglycine-generating enzyme required for sulfatase activity
VYSTTNPYVACNFLSWMDGAAYSDWAGLRPMTELEFEKACRGLETPVANEYAWGTATVAGNAYTLENDNATNEGIASNYSTSTGNASYDITDGSIDGPLRVGIFAANADNQGRITAGASYYGIMELSGNLWERAVTVGNATGRDFTGLHGNGALSTNGHANETAWPGLTSGEVTGATGSGFRGGSWNSAATYMRVSARFYAAFSNSNRVNNYGFRAVRVAP